MTKYIRDYYKILKIKKTSNQKTIKKAYKRLTLKYQSNTNKNKKTKEKYLLIQEAYTVLSNPSKKAKYDKLYNQANKKNKSNIKIKDTIKVLKDINDNKGIITKGIKTVSTTIKSQTLLTGSNIILGAAAGYGINKGYKFMKGKL